MTQTSPKWNILSECRSSQLGPWQCPPFLFLVMGVVIVLAMITTYIFASRYVDQPEIAAVIVAGVTVILLIIGHAIINGFSKIAEANRMKTEFVSIITHQLRSPLSVFKWTLNVIDRELQQNSKPDKLKDFIATLNNSTESMIQLVNTLLEISRMEAQRFILKKTTFDLEAITKNQLETYSHYAAAAKLSLSFKSNSALPAVYGDQERVVIVIQNLIDNAIKYSKGPGDIMIRITRNSPTYIKWEIEDAGVGIPESEKKYMFTKFFRASNARIQHTHGTGIGLYTVRAIIEASGGEIGFTSQINKGSTFWFTLPVAKTAITQKSNNPTQM